MSRPSPLAYASAIAVLGLGAAWIALAVATAAGLIVPSLADFSFDIFAATLFIAGFAALCTGVGWLIWRSGRIALIDGGPDRAPRPRVLILIGEILAAAGLAAMLISAGALAYWLAREGIYLVAQRKWSDIPMYLAIAGPTGGLFVGAGWILWIAGRKIAGRRVFSACGN